MIRNGVRTGVAGSQHRGERFAGRVHEAEQRVEPEPALVGRGGPLLVLGVDLDQRRVHVQRHLAGARRGGHAPPHACAHHRGLRPQDVQCHGVIARIVRYRVESDATLANKRGCEARNSMSEHASPPAASITSRASTPSHDHGSGHVPRTTRSPTTKPDRARSGQRNGPTRATPHEPLPGSRQVPRPRPTRCYRSPRECPPVRVLDASQHQESLTARAFPRIRDLSPPQTRDGSGLVVRGRRSIRTSCMSRRSGWCWRSNVRRVRSTGR